MSRLTLILVLLPLAGCAHTETIAQLGFPVFEPVVGKHTQYESMPSEQGVDARPAEGEVGARHLAHFWPVPAGDKDTVFVAVGVEPGPETTALKQLAVAAYPLEQTAVQVFSQAGHLPAQSPLLGFAQADVDADGAARLLLKVPRDELPKDTQYLAIPILAVYEDGWIQMRFFRSQVPDPYELPDPARPEGGDDQR